MTIIDESSFKFGRRRQFLRFPSLRNGLAMEDVDSRGRCRSSRRSLRARTSARLPALPALGDTSTLILYLFAGSFILSVLFLRYTSYLRKAGWRR